MTCCHKTWFVLHDCQGSHGVADSEHRNDPVMRAIGLTRYLPASHHESLVDVVLPDPSPGPNDVRVRVGAISVNPVDTKVRAPKDKTEETPRVLGWDAVGVVDQVGAAVTAFR